MKKILLLLFLGTALTFAQNRRFIYEYKYVPDLTQKDTIRKDLMALDITKSGSVYKSLTKMAEDSLVRSDFEKMMKTQTGSNRSFNFKSHRKPWQIDYMVTKEYPSYKTYLSDRIGNQMYKISEDEKFNWKILPDKQKIGSYNAQKATADFGGRSWIAWFTTDLPFQDGPYKFCGLPGLIVKIEDVSGTHAMTLVANKEIPPVTASEADSADGKIIIGLGDKEIPVTEKQFKKAWADYIADPAKEFRGMNSGPDVHGNTRTITMTDATGKVLDINEIQKRMEKNVKFKLEHDNNKIEPTLYK